MTKATGNTAEQIDPLISSLKQGITHLMAHDSTQEVYDAICKFLPKYFAILKDDFQYQFTLFFRSKHRPTELSPIKSRGHIKGGIKTSIIKQMKEGMDPIAAEPVFRPGNRMRLLKATEYDGPIQDELLETIANDIEIDALYGVIEEYCCSIAVVRKERAYTIGHINTEENIYIPTIFIKDAIAKKTDRDYVDNLHHKSFFTYMLENLCSYISSQRMHDLQWFTLEESYINTLHLNTAEMLLSNAFGEYGRKAFMDISTISAMTYETKECMAEIAFGFAAKPEVDLSFADKISRDNYRKVRKLLELCDDKNSMCFHDGYFFGLCTKKQIHSRCGGNFFTIRFISRLHWELRYKGTLIFRHSFGKIELAEGDFESEKSFERIKNTLSVPSPVAQKIFQLIIAAKSTQKGATLVFTEKAKSEAERLCKDSVGIMSYKLTPENIKPLLSVDGAVLSDLNGNCYAFGTILDGLSKQDSADSSRGSRYNSAWRYYHKIKNNTLIVVISDDGMIDIIPAHHKRKRK